MAQNREATNPRNWNPSWVSNHLLVSIWVGPAPTLVYRNDFDVQYMVSRVAANFRGSSTTAQTTTAKSHRLPEVDPLDRGEGVDDSDERKFDRGYHRARRRSDFIHQ